MERLTRPARRSRRCASSAIRVAGRSRTWPCSSGATRSLVQKWEVGKHFPRPATWQRLADLFEVEVDAITFGQLEGQG